MKSLCNDSCQKSGSQKVFKFSLLFDDTIFAATEFEAKTSGGLSLQRLNPPWDLAITPLLWSASAAMLPIVAGISHTLFGPLTGHISWSIQAFPRSIMRGMKCGW
jgi:hypothetical protein